MIPTTPGFSNPEALCPERLELTPGHLRLTPRANQMHAPRALQTFSQLLGQVLRHPQNSRQVTLQQSEMKDVTMKTNMCN